MGLLVVCRIVQLYTFFFALRSDKYSLYKRSAVKGKGGDFRSEAEKILPDLDKQAYRLPFRAQRKKKALLQHTFVFAVTKLQKFI